MINKNKIPIKKINYKYSKTIDYDIIFSPVYGSLTREIMNKSNNRSDIIILDIGQSFNDINETLAVLNEFKHYPMKNFIWIDHHKWKEEILHEFKNILLVQEKDSCAQVVNPDLIRACPINIF